MDTIELITEVDTEFLDPFMVERITEFYERHKASYEAVKLMDNPTAFEKKCAKENKKIAKAMREVINYFSNPDDWV